MSKFELSSFEEVLNAFSEGRPIVMVDESTRENEGDLVVASEHIRADQIAFMIRHCRGLPCITISGEVARTKVLPYQVCDNRSAFQTPFAVSIDHVSVGEFGGSASGRATTIRRLVSSDSQAKEFITPGNVFPLVAHPRGVFGRRGQTEGSFDLARLAGGVASAVICEILDENGCVRRGEDLWRFCRDYDLPITSVVSVLQERNKREPWVHITASAEVVSDYGIFRTEVVEDEASNKEHLVLTHGAPSDKHTYPLVRIHSECLTGDLLQSERCDCGPQLDQAMKAIINSGYGIVIYLRQEGRGIGLSNKLRAYSLQDKGLDTVEANEALGFAADQRDFSVATSILKAKGHLHINLLTNNPNKVSTLTAGGIKVVERIPLIIQPTTHSKNYLLTKREKLGHFL